MERFEKIATLDNEIEALCVRANWKSEVYLLRCGATMIWRTMGCSSSPVVGATSKLRWNIGTRFWKSFQLIRNRSAPRNDEVAEQEVPVTSAVKPHTDTDDVAAGAQDGRQQEVCPRCGSVAVREEFSHTAVLQWLTIWPFLPVRRRWSCEECGHSWKRASNGEHGPQHGTAAGAYRPSERKETFRGDQE